MKMSFIMEAGLMDGVETDVAVEKAVEVPTAAHRSLLDD